MGVILVVGFAVEGFTLLQVRGQLKLHVFVGTLLIPPVLAKIGSTGWRFVKYYGGSPAYRRKGPPPTILRLLGPLVVVLTIVLLASGVGLIFDRNGLGGQLGFIHRASFVLWFGAMTIHVLGHIAETARVAPRDWAHRTRREVAGASARQWTMAVSLAVGCILGIVMMSPTTRYLSHTGFGFLHH